MPRVRVRGGNVRVLVRVRCNVRGGNVRGGRGSKIGDKGNKCRKGNEGDKGNDTGHVFSFC
jgi:hypothetical protein